MIMISYWVFSYIVGMILTAWFVGKWKGIDLRTQQSGNLGARNAGTVLGKGAFLLTFLGDGGKGALVILIGRWLDVQDIVLAIGFFLVVLGHLYPIWLRGKGGKGIATFIGAGLAFHPIAFSFVILFFILFLAITRSATLSMNIAFITYPIYFLWIENMPIFSVVTLLVVLLLWRHRFDTKESWDVRWWAHKVS